MNIDWDAIVKTYDVRGLVGKSLTTEIVSALAAGFVDELDAAGQDVVVGYDMRDSSPEFADAFAAGAPTWCQSVFAQPTRATLLQAF
jgi:phosphomannomutase